jgi:polyhydroxyalkanoate synthesis regulator phasin
MRDSIWNKDYDYSSTLHTTRFEVEQMFRDYDADIASDMDVMRSDIKWLMEQVRELKAENEKLKSGNFDPKEPLV